MRKKLFIVAIAGLLVSGYLFVAYTTGVPLTCGAGHGCNEVQASVYASHFGIPTPAYGIVFYLLLAVGALLATPENRRGLLPWLKALTAIGLLSSAYFTYLEAFVIHAWCIWCVASAVLTVIAFWLVWRNTTPQQTGQVDSEQ